MYDLTIITPTGGRPEAFAFCEGYVSRSSFNGKIQWLVVDDCEPETQCTLGQIKIVPNEKWMPGKQTLAKNFRMALSFVEADKVIIIEDDDWYHKDYIPFMVEALDQYELVGEGKAVFYNVSNRTWVNCNNDKHASLCQTAFRSSLIGNIKQALYGFDKPNIDTIILWKFDCHKKIFFNEKLLSVGIKGLPGRAGIGVGHKKHKNTDESLTKLRELIGDDAEKYEKYYST